MNSLLTRVLERLEQAAGLWLFLDYDGTLADFAPTPDIIIPDPDLIHLLKQLAARPRTRVTIISGRRLDHIQKLLPVQEVFLAGTYGIELRFADGKTVERLGLATIRPVLEGIKPAWEALLRGRYGFYLEDKVWALAVHARFASPDEARQVLDLAQAVAMEKAPAENFQLHRDALFLEVGPRLARKGLAVTYLLENFSWPGALLLYFGDDDKDEDAFEVIEAQQGIAVNVSVNPRPTQASARLPSPSAVRKWLARLLVCMKDY